MTDSSPGEAAVVLVGGRSSRMGAAKATLEWHGSTLLQRTVRIAARAVNGPVVVVRAPGQKLPLLPRAVQVVDDPVAGRGPLQGVAIGLAAAAEQAATAVVCAVDLPLLHPAFVRRVVRELRADAALEIALPVAGGYAQPLAAAYRTVLVPKITKLVAAGTLRVQTLLERCRVQTLDEPTLLADRMLAEVDPRLESLLNVNTPAEYEEARGRPAPPVRVECFLDGTPRLDLGPRPVRAATLRAAADAVGLTFDASVVAVIEEPGVDAHRSTDPEFPLVRGDTVTFLPAGEQC